jgi:hypothetical protein
VVLLCTFGIADSEMSENGVEKPPVARPVPVACLSW